MARPQWDQLAPLGQARRRLLAEYVAHATKRDAGSPISSRDMLRGMRPAYCDTDEFKWSCDKEP